MSEGIFQTSITYAHDLAKSLESSTRAFPRLTKGFQQSGNRLVDRSCAKMFLQDIKRFSSSRSYVGFIIHQRHANDRNNIVLMTLSLTVRRAFAR